MGNLWGKLLLLLSGMLLLTSGAWAAYGGASSAMPPGRLMSTSTAHGANLVPFLQGEVNEIAMLTAQQNYLLQQGDTVGAVLVASYIPDHQTQATALSQRIQQRGGNPGAIQANMTNPYLGTRAQILAYDAQQHAQVIAQYHKLTGAGTLATRQLAFMGLSGAQRHFASLQVAMGATDGSPVAVLNGLSFDLQLERTAMLDLRTQAAQLRRMHDATTADRLLSLVPTHQAQAARLEALITQMGGNPAKVSVTSVASLPTRDAILAHFRQLDIQLANTYAVQIAAFPGGSPIQVASIRGQNNALTAIAVLFGGPLPPVS